MQMSVLLACGSLFFIHPHLSAVLFVGTPLALYLRYTDSDCVKWYIFQEVGTQVLIAAVESILIVRGVLSLFSPYRYAEHSSSTRLV